MTTIDHRTPVDGVVFGSNGDLPTVRFRAPPICGGWESMGPDLVEYTVTCDRYVLWDCANYPGLPQWDALVRLKQPDFD